MKIKRLEEKIEIGFGLELQRVQIGRRKFWMSPQGQKSKIKRGGVSINCKTHLFTKDLTGQNLRKIYLDGNSILSITKF